MSNVDITTKTYPIWTKIAKLVYMVDITIVNEV